jgi:putative ABC transport system permease protein
MAVFYLRQSIRIFYRNSMTTLLVIISLSAGLTVLLGILSLLSMVRHLSLVRTKEIGIRKVFGTTPLNIITLLNIHFIKWIAASVILGISLSWIFLTNWMDSFAYRQPVSIWIFILSGAGTLLADMLAVTVQSASAAARIPVDSIKYE